MALRSINPYTNEVEKSFEELTEKEIKTKIDRAQEAFGSWKNTLIEERAELMMKASGILADEKEKFAEIITREMGRLYRESLPEVEPLSTSIFEYYAKNAEKLLQPEILEDYTNGEALVEKLPLGIIFAIEPWNYPFYQIFRIAVPVIMAGNVFMLKHASNVPQASEAAEGLFKRAGFPEGVFTNLHIGADRTGIVIGDKRIRAVSLTGSESAGMSVSSQAGKNLKKSVLELGGNDPFIILDDADFDHAFERAFYSKMHNSGQTCVAPKRFIVTGKHYDEFIDRMKTRMESLRPGDPMVKDTGYGPLVSITERDKLLADIKKAVEQGATLVTGGDIEDLPGAWLKPTILTDVTPENHVFDKELFGPVAVVYKARDEDEAIEIANNSSFGLGSSIFSQDIEKAEKLAKRLETGMTFINIQSISRAELPFGGVKNSGYGRELGYNGLDEYVNKKLIVKVTK
ncbi:MAG: NAD-dependent succinate-semialdehyde dehydrogenase [Methanosarcinaceae archaeon]|nr:NAD-dependent succinate-semialdehyde dehydrogenase [Methanosarcinaceae archaeon]